MTNKTLITLCLLTLLFTCCKASKTNELHINNSLLLKINVKKPIVKKSNMLSVSFELSNTTDTTYILYAFKSIEDGICSMKVYCENDNSSGTTIIIEKNGTQVFPKYFLDGFSFDSPPVGINDLIDSFDQEKKRFSANKIVINPHSSEKFQLKINLDNYELSPGEYDLSFIHFSGINLKNFIDEQSQKLDKEKYSGKIYSGCLQSNRIRFLKQ